MKQVKIGFLPLYLKLYDERSKKVRPAIDAYCADVIESIKGEGALVAAADVCRTRDESLAAVRRFEEEGVDAIVTLHLAYSPSLESIDALAGTKLPLLLLDTTRDYSFSPEDKDMTMYNHGIHGVQDLCNLLRRRGKEYSVFVGPHKESDVVKRTIDAARAILAAKSLRGSRAGKVGGGFQGMGDFLPTKKAWRRLGVTVLDCDSEELSALQASVTEDEVRAEYEQDCKENGANSVTYEEYSFASRVGLGVRKWAEKHALLGFTMTFLSAGTKGFETMPFSEASKAMARGIGYAGEGDALTAAFIGALMQGFEKVNFAEMFCPNWKGGSVYMSHMGESNLALLEARHTVVKPFPYSDSPNPTCVLGHMVPGRACVLNLLPNGEDWFDLVIVPGEMLKVPEELDNYHTSMCGWFKPDRELTDMLEKYSELGGTHHSALVYGVDASSLALFAKTLGMKCTIL